MRKLHYHRVDVFTDRAFGGNPLAVFTNGRGVSAETMQAIAKEFNLSETTFVLPPDDPAHDWRVRIFTPGSELPMAGHPTVGTSFILAREHLVETKQDGEVLITLEEGVGPVPVRLEFEAGLPAYAEMSQPLPTFGPRFKDPKAIADMLSLEVADVTNTGLPYEVVSCGVPFLFVCVQGLEQMRRIRFRTDVFERVAAEVGVPGLFVFAREVESFEAQIHSRMFAPGAGILEDPATGGASGPLGCFLFRHGAVSRRAPVNFVSEQGIEMGRPSYIRIKIEHEGDEITGVKVGGKCHYMGEGFIEV
ncbi:MAG TPA: PhzF family phenazine biosynthesis protein [Pyrinomonadaceae bacterium]|nr:PhzF family phenazine biosynthesis protein [Pyrinomonadaceae bacterium]